MYGSRNLGNGKVEVQKAIELPNVIASALKAPGDAESMEFVKKLEAW